MKLPSIPIQFNAPTTLGFIFMSLGVQFTNVHVLKGVTDTFFTNYPQTHDWLDPLSWFRLVSYIFGHSGWLHCLGNMEYIIMLGGLIEEKYGSIKLFFFILFTGFITGVLNVSLFNVGVRGASGIVFLFIILAGITNTKSGKIPLTSMLLFNLHVVAEIKRGFMPNNISEYCHIMGAVLAVIIGSLFSQNYKNKYHKANKEARTSQREIRKLRKINTKLRGE